MGRGEVFTEASLLYLEVLKRCLEKSEANLTNTELSEENFFVLLASDTVFHTWLAFTVW